MYFWAQQSQQNIQSKIKEMQETPTHRFQFQKAAVAPLSPDPLALLCHHHYPEDGWDQATLGAV